MEIEAITQLGGTVFTTALFIWYLRDKNGKSERAQKGIVDAMDRVSRHQEVHTRVLMRIAQQHGLNSDSDDPQHPSTILEGRIILEGKTIFE